MIQKQQNVRIILLSIVLLTLVGIFFFGKSSKKQEDFAELVKIAMRDVGDKLLRYDQDSTSLVQPVKRLKQYTYQLSFDEPLTIAPDTLVKVVENSFDRTELPNNYRVMVKQCEDQEVAYSYQMMAQVENTIVACSGRNLPSKCYTIEVKFVDQATSVEIQNNIVLIGIVSIGIVLLIVLIKAFKYPKNEPTHETNTTQKAKHDGVRIGSFWFVEDQLKLIQESKEIQLSKKECELLAILAANPNQLVTRDELTKRIWEDNGVYVGRSLDTYISKLRKKLQLDETLKITNSHGVGYKLEIAK
ncbi:helix-turn-helix domain-containing protein [Aquimarina brevivitae]|uniref:Transcriptional regulator n=1 Tax=Aquimarina brevivitae TaxID=323412 RepID=A0A4Q7P246_9FLAO|nr:winged helix-turn-helix domain-containing protein [Aquimarina brevivitae]RZS93814.1 transcriptional regulator [Aquimarina brevivitae]